MFAHQTIPNIFIFIDKELGNGQDLNNSISLLLIFNYFAEYSKDKEIIIEENYKESFINILIEYSEPIIKFINKTILEVKQYNKDKSQNVNQNVSNNNTAPRNVRVDNKAVRI